LSQPEYLPWFARKLKVMVQEKRDVTMMVGKASGSSWLDASRKLAMREIEEIRTQGFLLFHLRCSVRHLSWHGLGLGCLPISSFHGSDFLNQPKKMKSALF
jgi:heterodisulfide reductase subunit B